MQHVHARTDRRILESVLVGRTAKVVSRTAKVVSPHTEQHVIL